MKDYTGRLNVQLIKDIKYLLLYSCVTVVSAFFLCTRLCQLFFRYDRASFFPCTAVSRFFHVRPSTHAPTRVPIDVEDI